MSNNDQDKKRSKIEEDKGQKFVDDIPLEDLKIEQEDEKKKSKSKDSSESERKHNKEK